MSVTDDPSTAAVVRPARADDAEPMAHLLDELIAIGGTTSHREPFDARRIRETFIEVPRGVSCFVALVGGEVAGFQALEWSDPEWTGEHPLPADWAFISTYVSAAHHRRGIGQALFARTAEAARRAGVTAIDATIRRENTGGLAFYASLGFRDYRGDAETVSKRFDPHGE
ncbi:MAG: N-acetyltransferase [Microbacteriaceae bacterium]|nr:MAG: N-acetyltransferase [Microbacteriaceae bacterium]